MICEYNKCTSCYSCYNICPRQCISMSENEYGFIRPIVNMDKCIKCNLCRKVCPSINHVKYRTPESAYAAWALSSYERNSSTSGGAASVFSNYIIEHNGVVFGASMENKIIRHIKIYDKEDLIKLKGSKYVHSEINYSYREAKKELNMGKKVLFIGTPCQIAGANRYLNKEYPNFITIDIICHGVPSQKILKGYIKENFRNVDYDNISFRDKNGFNFKLLKENKILINLSMEKSLYYLGFMKSLFYNEACYNCLYANKNRISDITIGDFWGLGDIEPFKHDKSKGVSLLLSNTQKGLKLIDKCKDKMFLEKRNVDEAINGNDQLKKPSSKHKNYELFKKLYLKKGFNYAAYRSLQRDINLYKIKKNIKKSKVMLNLFKKFKNRRT